MLSFPLRLPAKIILPVGLATIAVYIIRNVLDISVVIVVGLTLAVSILTVVGDWLSYSSSEAGLTLLVARKHGYKGPYLRFPKKWKHPQDLLPGELTCIRFGAVAKDSAGSYRLITDSCKHQTSATAHYFVWRDHNRYYVLSIREKKQLIIDVINNSRGLGGLTEPVYLLPYKIDMHCPHFLQPSYSDE